MIKRILAVASIIAGATLLNGAAAHAGGGVSLSPSDGAAIRGAIARQIDAFKRDDGPAAFAIASAKIQEIFRTPERFLAMAKAGYRPVYRPQHVRFREPVVIAGRLIQPVLVIGPDGVPATALYIMERDSAGEWRIGGCVIADEPETGA
jgi:hypothetical protein